MNCAAPRIGAVALAHAFCRKLIAERRLWVFVAPLGVLGLLALFGLSAWQTPALLTGPTARSLHEYAQSHYASLPTSSAMLLAALFGQGPFLAALIVTLSASSTASNLVTTEIQRGTFEAMLPQVGSGERLVTALLLATVGICLLDWLLCLAAVVAVAAIAVSIAGAWSLVNGHFVAVALLLPAPLAILGAAVGVAIALKWPWLAQFRIGATGSVTQLLGALPTLALLIYATLKPAAMTTGVLVLCWFIAATLAALVCLALPSAIDRTELIGAGPS